MKKVSFVIPCYRSEHTLPHVVKEIREKMQELTQYEYDIFLVNDASPDNTMGTIRDLCDKYDNIKGIGFARNFGQHAALMAGLRHSDGDYVVCLDDDGQTPADEVDKLLNDAGCPACPVNTLDRLVVDPQIAGARGMFPTIDQPGIGELQITAIPAHTTRTSTAPRKAAPLLGEDNADVYGKLLGLDEAKLADLKAKGVI